MGNRVNEPSGDRVIAGQGSLSLRRAAAELGVNRQTLRGWLEELGLRFMPVRRGSKYLVRREDLERLEKIRSGHVYATQPPTCGERRRTMNADGRGLES